MDECRFDNWTRMLGALQDRRVAVKEMAAAGAALVGLARLDLGLAQEDEVFIEGCRGEKEKCRRNNQCCSGTCKRKRRKNWFCAKCERDLSLDCVNCGATLTAGDASCYRCGTRTGVAGDALPG